MSNFCAIMLISIRILEQSGAKPPTSGRLANEKVLISGCCEMVAACPSRRAAACLDEVAAVIANTHVQVPLFFF